MKLTLTSSSGNSDDTTPIFTWNEDLYSTWYRLFIWDSSEKTVRAEWYEASDICSGGSCTVSLEAELSSGSYDCWVKSWNDYGSVWSDGISFAVQGNDTPPSKVTHTSPSGTTQNLMPTYTWVRDPESTWYRLWIGDNSTDKIFAQWYEASEICTDGNCSVTPETELLPGNYEWYVKSWNELGKLWSDGMSFTVSE